VWVPLCAALCLTFVFCKMGLVKTHPYWFVVRLTKISEVKIWFVYNEGGAEQCDIMSAGLVSSFSHSERSLSLLRESHL
jgi:hypothetical protein